MHGIGRKRLAATAGLAGIAASVFIVVHLLAAKGLIWAANVSVVATFILAAVIAAAPFFGTLLGWLRGTAPISKVTFRQARASLADAFAQQWAEEDRLRRVNDPWRLSVRWHVVGAASPSECGGAEFLASTHEGEERSSEDIYEAFTSVAARRIVILGQAGAGKTVLAIRLVRELLAVRKSDDQVPMLLSAATWSRNCSMTEWIAEQLIQSQPGMDVRVRTDTGDIVPLPRALADGAVLPVIDGLDELPPDRRAAVVAEVNAYGSDNPLIITSRPEEYWAAASTRQVSQAAVIELASLDLAEVKRYLTQATAAPTDRWQNVLDQLDVEPEGVLASTLTIPLMIWLTRTVYEEANSNPDELLAPSLRSERAAIESHLIAAFVPAVYSGRQQRSRSRNFRCTSGQATRWIGFLASWLNRSGNQEIAWWRLSLGEPGWLTILMTIRAALYAGVLWLASVWLLSRHGYWRHGSYAGHGHYQNLLLAGPLGRAVQPTVTAALHYMMRPTAMSHRHMNSIVVSVITFLSHFYSWHVSSRADSVMRFLARWGPTRFVGIIAGCGFIIGLTEVVRKPVSVPRTLQLRWRSFREGAFKWGPWVTVFVFAWFYAGFHNQPLVAVLRTSIGQLLLLLLGLLLASATVKSLITPTDVVTSTSPLGQLRADRHVYLLSLARIVISFGIIWLWAGSLFAEAAIARSAADMLIVLLLGGSEGAWPRYLESRVRLAIRGRLPWRVISFLDDAHQRGVLRQAGAVYQFRHIRLQEQLAAGYSPWPPPLVPVAAWADRQLGRLRHFLSARILDDLQSNAAASDTIDYAASGEIRAVPAKSIRLMRGLLLLPVAALVIAIGLRNWWSLLIVVISLSIGVRTLMVLGRREADARLPSGCWSINVMPHAIKLRRASDRITLTPDDIEQIEVRPIGNFTFTVALQAKLRSGLAPVVRARGDWLPLYWAPGYTRRIPHAMISAMARFAGDRLDPRLRGWLHRQDVVEYEASGTVRVTTIAATLGTMILAAVSLTIALTVVGIVIGSSFLVLVAGLADIVLLGICYRRLSIRAAKLKLPPGEWSLCVHVDAIELTRASHSGQLLPGDVERLELRPLGKNSARVAVYAHLRSEAARRFHALDGRFLIYWEPELTPYIPADLVISLAEFSRGRLTGSLKRKAKRARNPKVPVNY